jgi:hypothetical protein
MIDQKRLVSFLDEYTLFFESMVDAERVKLNTLLSNDIKAIEENILVQQVDAKRMENMENRRISLFSEYKLEQVSLKELIEIFEKDKINLNKYYQRIDFALQQIKYLNKKSMELIRFNLKMVETRTNKEYGYDMKGGR